MKKPILRENTIVNSPSEEDVELPASSYRNFLELAKEHEISLIAVLGISSGGDTHEVLQIS